MFNIMRSRGYFWLLNVHLQKISLSRKLAVKCFILRNVFSCEFCEVSVANYIMFQVSEIFIIDILRVVPVQLRLTHVATQ